MAEARQIDLVRKGSSVVSATPTMDVLFEPIDNTLFNYLLLRAYGDIVPGVGIVHKIPVREVMEYLKIDRVSKLHASLERLGKGTISIDYIDDENVERTMYAHYLSSDVSRTGSGLLEFSFDTILSRFLYEPKVYALISVNRLRDLKSYASQKLYEVMVLNFRKKSPVWSTTVEELRNYFQTGDRNARFDNFRVHVIEKAIAEVNAIAEFDVLVDYIRGGQGGGVVEIVFKAVSKSHRRLMETATVKAIGTRRKKVDLHTVDMLDGLTFEERGGPAEVTAEGIEKARALIPEDGDINVLLTEWRESVRGLSLTDPDGHFLGWMRLKLEQDNDPLLKDIEGDVFGQLLGGRD